MTRRRCWRSRASDPTSWRATATSCFKCCGGEDHRGRGGPRLDPLHARRPAHRLRRRRVDAHGIPVGQGRHRRRVDRLGRGLRLQLHPRHQGRARADGRPPAHRPGPEPGHAAYGRAPADPPPVRPLWRDPVRDRRGRHRPLGPGRQERRPAPGGAPRRRRPAVGPRLCQPAQVPGFRAGRGDRRPGRGRRVHAGEGARDG